MHVLLLVMSLFSVYLAKPSFPAVGPWAWGDKGSGRKPPPARVLVLWVGRRRRTAAHFARARGRCLAVGSHGTQPARGWTRGSLRSLGLTEARDNRLSVLGISDTARYRVRAQNKMGAPRAAGSSPGPKGGGGRGRGGAVWFPRGRESLVQSLAGVQEGLPVGG